MYKVWKPHTLHGSGRTGGSPGNLPAVRDCKSGVI